MISPIFKSSSRSFSYFTLLVHVQLKLYWGGYQIKYNVLITIIKNNNEETKGLFE